MDERLREIAALLPLDRVVFLREEAGRPAGGTGSLKPLPGCGLLPAFQERASAIQNPQS